MSMYALQVIGGQEVEIMQKLRRKGVDLSLIHISEPTRH